MNCRLAEVIRKEPVKKDECSCCKNVFRICHCCENDFIMCHCEERSDEAISMPLCAKHGLAVLLDRMQEY